MTNYHTIINMTHKQLGNFLERVYITGCITGHQSVVEADLLVDNPYNIEWLKKNVESKQLSVVEPEAISMVGEPVNEYGVSEDFESDFDSWISNGKPDEKRILVGTTSLALQSIGIAENKIVWNTSKINIIQRKHPDMSDNVLRQVPNIIGNPVIIMESITRANRITIYGEVYNDEGIPVMAALELLPSGRKNKVLLDTIRIASTYAREGGIRAVQNLIDNSNILYVCPDNERTDTWLSHNQLQLPFGITKYGSLGNVSYFDRNVNGNIEFPLDKSGINDTLPMWKERLKELELTDDI